MVLDVPRREAELGSEEGGTQLGPGLAAEASGQARAVLGPVISKYESREMMPSSRVLVGLGKSLGDTLAFLMSGEVEELAGMEFRKHSCTSARDRAWVEAIVTEALQSYLAVEDILELAARGRSVRGGAARPRRELRRKSTARPWPRRPAVCRRRP